MSFDVDMNEFVALQEENHALERENERLRKALEWIASNEVDPYDARPQLEAAIRRARAALTPDQETSTE